MRKTIISAMLIGIVTSAAIARDKDKLQPVPQIFQDLVDCKVIAEPEQRLACYDERVTRVADAQKANELQVVDKAQIKEAKRGLFGLSLPDIKIFGGNDDEISNITSKVISVSQGADGWVLEIEDGATWVQTDGVPLGRTPKVGDAIEIKKGVLGSFKARVANGVSFKAKRINR